MMNKETEKLNEQLFSQTKFSSTYFSFPPVQKFVENIFIYLYMYSYACIHTCTDTHTHISSADLKLCFFLTYFSCDDSILATV